jgi:protein TonB
VRNKLLITASSFILFLSVSGFKPPKSPYPKNDILYSKYGGDVEKMMKEERRLDSLAHPYLYQIQETEKKPETNSIDDESVILDNADVMPEFPDGAAGLQDYLASGTAFIPDTLVGKKATVLVKFYINTLGDAKDPKIVKTDDPSFDTYSVMLIDGMPKWTPAKHKGKDVNCYYTLTIKYGQ